MDFATALPHSPKGNNAVWVVVDRLTKSAHTIQSGTIYRASGRQVHERDSSAAWSSYYYRVGQRHEVQISLLGEPSRESVDPSEVQHILPSRDRRAVRTDHSDPRKHVEGL